MIHSSEVDVMERQSFRNRYRLPWPQYRAMIGYDEQTARREEILSGLVHSLQGHLAEPVSSWFSRSRVLLDGQSASQVLCDGDWDPEDEEVILVVILAERALGPCHRSVLP